MNNRYRNTNILLHETLDYYPPEIPGLEVFYEIDQGVNVTMLIKPNIFFKESILFPFHLSGQEYAINEPEAPRSTPLNSSIDSSIGAHFDTPYFDYSDSSSLNIQGLGQEGPFNNFEFSESNQDSHLTGISREIEREPNYEPISMNCRNPNCDALLSFSDIDVCQRCRDYFMEHKRLRKPALGQ